MCVCVPQFESITDDSFPRLWLHGSEGISTVMTPLALGATRDVALDLADGVDL